MWYNRNIPIKKLTKGGIFMPKGQPNKSELTVFFYLFLYRRAMKQKYTLHSDFIHKVAPIRSAFHTSF
jgi:hypothetical protein